MKTFPSAGVFLGLLVGGMVPVQSISGFSGRDAEVPETFDVGMLRVERFGRPGQTPIIFIPALFCGSWQWQREIAALRDRYEIYALTLPGFDGRPRDTGGDLMHRAASDISTLISSRHLDHPILVGHSLGGTLAIAFAADHPGEIRSIIAVEGGYPIGPTQAVREQRVKASTAAYIGVDSAAFRTALRTNMLQYVITSKTDVDTMERLAARSDAAATVQWMTEALLLDLTPRLQDLRVPVTEIVPFDSLIDGYQGYASASAKRSAYATWLAHARDGEVILIDHSRHFVMLDQPEAFDRALFARIERDARRH
ncbi:MAG TPA: alpha/beta hydrolase [Gemmatimonadales bacterium]|nr:alpha/beta hydrolase [Gemmatimonadales bacterium]